MPLLRSSTIDCSATSRASARLAGRVEVDRRADRVGVVEVDATRGPSGIGDQSGSSRPSPAFCSSTRRSARSTSASSTCAGAHCLDERLAEGLDGGQLDVDAGVEGGAGGLGPRAGDAVQHAQEGDAEVVGDDGAVEAPGVAQQIR